MSCTPLKNLIHTFISIHNQNLMNAYYVPNLELGAEDIAMNKMDETPVLSQNLGFQKMQTHRKDCSQSLQLVHSMIP